MQLAEALDQDDCRERYRAVHMRERFRGVAELLVHQGHVKLAFVHMQQQQCSGIAIEPVDNAGPLFGGAAMNESLVFQFDVAGGTGMPAVVE